MSHEKEGFHFDPNVKKRLLKVNEEKEKYLFLALCPQSDRELIQNKKGITLEDFDRISYLLYKLGLNCYEIRFQMEHKDLLQQLGEQIKSEVENDTVDIAKELMKHEQWLNDFIRQLPTPHMQKCLQQLFQI